MRSWIICVTLFAALCACQVHYIDCDRGSRADLVLLGGRIETVDPELGEVEALAARGGEVVAVGSDEEIERWVGPETRVIELEGRRALPGFVEGHGHFTDIGEALQILQLREARSWEEIVEQVAAAAEVAAPGEWILGRGWHQEKWTTPPTPSVGGFPGHEVLSALTPENPVALEHASGHASFFNRRAMELAGVDAATPDPPGGEILRLASGEPCGVFTETAEELVLSVWRSDLASRGPEDAVRSLERSLRLADRECLAKGITSFQDAGSSFETIEVMREQVSRGELGVRLWVMVRDSNARLRAGVAAARLEGFGDEHLTVRAIKRSIDGALGSRGAWLHEPYADMPSSRGLSTTTVGSLEESARIAAAAGFQLCVHAIGDRANTEVLDLFERVLADHPELRGDHRWRVEHAQHLRPEDVPRFAELGVVASMQAIHCISDAPFVVPRLGEERARSGAYLWRDLLDSGALVSNGTDAPVEDVDPVANFHAAVTRRMADGSTFYPDQRMTRMEALRSATIDAARAAFEEGRKGSLTPGKLADVVVLSRDILTVPEEEILGARVLMTFVGGELLYEASPEGPGHPDPVILTD